MAPPIIQPYAKKAAGWVCERLAPFDKMEDEEEGEVHAGEDEVTRAYDREYNERCRKEAQMEVERVFVENPSSGTSMSTPERMGSELVVKTKVDISPERKEIVQRDIKRALEDVNKQLYPFIIEKETLVRQGRGKKGLIEESELFVKDWTEEELAQREEIRKRWEKKGERAIDGRIRVSGGYEDVMENRAMDDIKFLPTLRGNWESVNPRHTEDQDSGQEDEGDYQMFSEPPGRRGTMWSTASHLLEIEVRDKAQKRRDFQIPVAPQAFQPSRGISKEVSQPPRLAPSKVASNHLAIQSRQDLSSARGIPNKNIVAPQPKKIETAPFRSHQTSSSTRGTSKKISLPKDSSISRQTSASSQGDVNETSEPPKTERPPPTSRRPSYQSSFADRKKNSFRNTQKEKDSQPPSKSSKPPFFSASLSVEIFQVPPPRHPLKERESPVLSNQNLSKDLGGQPPSKAVQSEASSKVQRIPFGNTQPSRQSTTGRRPLISSNRSSQPLTLLQKSSLEDLQKYPYPETPKPISKTNSGTMRAAKDNKKSDSSEENFPFKRIQPRPKFLEKKRGDEDNSSDECPAFS